MPGEHPQRSHIRPASTAANAEQKLFENGRMTVLAADLIAQENGPPLEFAAGVRGVKLCVLFNDDRSQRAMTNDDSVPTSPGTDRTLLDPVHSEDKLASNLAHSSRMACCAARVDSISLRPNGRATHEKNGKAPAALERWENCVPTRDEAKSGHESTAEAPKHAFADPTELVRVKTGPTRVDVLHSGHPWGHTRRPNSTRRTVAGRTPGAIFCVDGIDKPRRPVDDTDARGDPASAISP